MDSEFRYWLILTVNAAACGGFFRIGLRLLSPRLLSIAGAFGVATVLTFWSARAGSAAMAGAGLAIGFLASVVGCAALADLNDRTRGF
jgi:hypothetical protein